MTVLLGHTTSRARKRHLCCECDQWIEVGTVYERQRAVDGPDAWTYKAHTECYRFSVKVNYGEPFNEPMNLVEDRAWALSMDPPAAVKARLSVPRQPTDPGVPA